MGLIPRIKLFRATALGIPHVGGGDSFFAFGDQRWMLFLMIFSVKQKNGMSSKQGMSSFFDKISPTKVGIIGSYMNRSDG